jgi:hypothetical protein
VKDIRVIDKKSRNGCKEDFCQLQILSNSLYYEINKHYQGYPNVKKFAIAIFQKKSISTFARVQKMSSGL